MPPADDIETRLATVERDVAKLREQLALSTSDAAVARTLAAGADHDVSEVRAELRAHTQALNTLRQTQLEQGREMREGFAEQSRRIDEHVRETREGFSTLATGMAQITALLTNLEGPAELYNEKLVSFAQRRSSASVSSQVSGPRSSRSSFKHRQARPTSQPW